MFCDSSVAGINWGFCFVCLISVNGNEGKNGDYQNQARVCDTFESESQDQQIKCSKHIISCSFMAFKNGKDIISLSSIEGAVLTSRSSSTCASGLPSLSSFSPPLISSVFSFLV